MKKLNKKGFTMVELIIVIVIIGVLAAVLIPTFGGIIRKANDSAYQQDRTNQMIQDAIEKIDQGKVYMSWEDLEEAIAKALAEKGDDDDLADKIIAIIGGLGKTSTGLTDEQLTKILDAIANKKFSDTQVKVILEGIKDDKDDEDDEKPALTEQQIAEILAKLPQVGITEDDLKAAITAVLGEQSGTINAAVQAILDKLPTPLTEEEIEQIVLAILDSLNDTPVEGTLVTTEDALNAALADNTIDRIIIGNDITLARRVLVDRDITIDLNGKTLTVNNATYTAGNSYNRAVFAVGNTNQGVTLTIESSQTGGLIRNDCENDDDAYGIVLYGSSLVINGGSIGGSSVQSIGGIQGMIDLYVNGGSINGIVFPDFCTLTLHNTGTYRVGSVGSDYGIVLPVTVACSDGLQYDGFTNKELSGVAYKEYVVYEVSND